MIARYVTLWILLLFAVVGSFAEMGEALGEFDLDRFSTWTCIASIFAFLAGYLVKLTPIFLAP